MDKDVTTQQVAHVLGELTGSMARAVVDHPDRVHVDLAISENTITLQLSVASADMGRVIGRKGRVANAMRTLLQASAGQAGHRVYLDIVHD